MRTLTLYIMVEEDDFQLLSALAQRAGTTAEAMLEVYVPLVVQSIIARSLSSDTSEDIEALGLQVAMKDPRIRRSLWETIRTRLGDDARAAWVKRFDTEPPEDR